MLNIELLKNASFQCDFSFISKVNFVLQHENYIKVNILLILREKICKKTLKVSRFLRNSWVIQEYKQP